MCSLESFVDLYAKYKLDGVIHFSQPKKVHQTPIIDVTASTSSEKLVNES